MDKKSLLDDLEAERHDPTWWLPRVHEDVDTEEACARRRRALLDEVSPKNRRVPPGERRWR